jgi:tetratricopeptide (TPR) repeat protein
MKRTTNLALVGMMLTASVGLAMPATLEAAPPKGKLKGQIARDVMEADDLMGKGKFEQAGERYKDAITRNDKNVPAIVGYGLSLSKQFKLDAAEEQFDKALQIDPKNAIAHVGKASVLLNKLNSSSMTIKTNRESMLRQAEEEARTGLQTDPYSPEGHYYLARALNEQGRFDEATSEFNEAIKSDAKFSEAYSGLGMVKLNQGSLSESESAFKSALQYNTGNSTAHYGLGKTYLKQGRIDDAIKELNTSLAQYPNSWPAHLAMGEAYAAQPGNNNAAVQEYQKSILIKAENPDAYLHIADIREGRGDLELSISELRAGLEQMPNNPDLHLRIGKNSLQLEKLDDALKEYELVLNQNPGSSEAAQGVTRCYYLKAQKDTAGAFMVSNEYEKAKGMIERAIALNPNDMELRLAAAKIRSLSGETVDLKSIGTPKTTGEKVAYAEACLAQNNFAEANRNMQDAINAQIDAKQTFAVADLALMIKDLDSAEQAYKKASTFSGGEERAKRGMDMIAKAREEARQSLTMADDMAKKKLTKTAVDKYHESVFENPKVPDTRINLSKTLEQLKPVQPPYLREAVVQIKAYIALSPNLPPKELEKLNKHMTQLENKAFKLEEKLKKKGK